MRVVPGTSSTVRSNVSANALHARPVRLHVVAAGVDKHDARVVLQQQAHHPLGALGPTLLDELLVLAHDGVALVQVGLGHVVGATRLRRLCGERLVGAQHHGDAVVHLGHHQGGVLGLEAQHGVRTEAVAEHDGGARLVPLGDGDAQPFLEALRAEVQLRIERLAVRTPSAAPSASSPSTAGQAMRSTSSPRSPACKPWAPGAALAPGAAPCLV